MEPDDEALLQQAQRGDRRALEGFWNRRSAEAFRLALLIGGSQDLARDALQEAWMGLVSTLPGFDPAKGSARGWLLSILRHKVQKLTWKQRRRPLSLDIPVSALDGGEATLGDLLVGGGAPPEAALQKREEIARMLQALEGLEFKMKEAVVCRWMMGMSDREMAEALSLSPEAARQRAHRGLRVLRGILVKTV